MDVIQKHTVKDTAQYMTTNVTSRSIQKRWQSIIKKIKKR